MNPSRLTKIQDLENARQARIRRSQLPADDQIRERLADLQTFIRQLAKTEYGREDLENRVRLFGECSPEVGESDRHFYGKLRVWLDRKYSAAEDGAKRLTSATS